MGRPEYETDINYYSILDVNFEADIEAIRKQYRKLALIHHPDRNKGNELKSKQKFQQLTLAYEILSDPQKKAKYDSVNRFPYFGGPNHRRASGAAAGHTAWDSSDWNFSTFTPPAQSNRKTSSARHTYANFGDTPSSANNTYWRFGSDAFPRSAPKTSSTTRNNTPPVSKAKSATPAAKRETSKKPPPPTQHSTKARPSSRASTRTSESHPDTGMRETTPTPYAFTYSGKKETVYRDPLRESRNTPNSAASFFANSKQAKGQPSPEHRKTKSTTQEETKNSKFKTRVEDEEEEEEEEELNSSASFHGPPSASKLDGETTNREHEQRLPRFTSSKFEFVPDVAELPPREPSPAKETPMFDFSQFANDLNNVFENSAPQQATSPPRVPKRATSKRPQRSKILDPLGDVGSIRDHLPVVSPMKSRTPPVASTFNFTPINSSNGPKMQEDQTPQPQHTPSFEFKFPPTHSFGIHHMHIEVPPSFNIPFPPALAVRNNLFTTLSLAEELMSKQGALQAYHTAFLSERTRFMLAMQEWENSVNLQASTSSLRDFYATREQLIFRWNEADLAHMQTMATWINKLETVRSTV